MEIWKQIEDLDYEINKYGIVRRISTKRIKKSFLRKDGYIQIQLMSYSKKYRMFQLHILIAKAFIENPLNKPFVNHIDANRANNTINNLEWVTHSENVKHSYKLGISNNKGSKNGFSILDENKVLEIRKLRKETNLSYRELAVKFNVSKSCIIGVVNRTNWKHI